MNTISLLATTILAAGLGAQQYIETFTFPDGPSVPGWTQQNLTWKIVSGTLVPNSGAGFHYITKDGFTNVGDCVVDIDLTYPPATKLYYGGVCARHPGGAGENGLVMTKLQDNTTGGSFTTMFMYERPGGAQSFAAAPTTRAATVRMIVKARTSQQFLDGNVDGWFEQSAVVRPFAAATTLNTGLVGADGYNDVFLDNWKFYDAVLVTDPAVGNAPRIGTTYNMLLTAPLVAANPTPWFGMLSLGKAGIPLGGNRAIPLSLDPLLLASLGLFRGTLTPAAPEAVFALPIPNDPSLIGLKVYAGAFTVDGSQPLSIGAISNDHGFQIAQ